MKRFFLETLGELGRGHCVITTSPDGLGLGAYRPAEGDRVGAMYPPGATTEMSPDHPGQKLPDVVPNTLRYLILSSRTKSVVHAACEFVEIEYLALRIMNHKGRLHGDAFIINPIGALDCLDLGASQIEYLDEPGDDYHGAVVGVDRFVLDRSKLVDAPALFRIKEEPFRYVIDERLAAPLMAGGFTNVVLEEIEQR
ncbi:MAG TPA: DUF1629 domain-containing protein [Byssovorax sp.]|jgi:hypothetical protein